MSVKAAPKPTGCLYTDIEGSTRRWESDPAAMQEAVARHYEIIETALDRHGGRIGDRAGDGVFALVRGGNPLAAALEIQTALAAEDWSAVDGLPVRIGVHAALLDEEGRAERVAANRVARIAECAWGGQILVSAEATEAFPLPDGARLDDFGAQRLRGVAASMHIFGLLHEALPQQSFPPLRSLRERDATLPAETGPLFGRERELQELEAAIGSDGGLLTIVAAGGTGKTRLLIELARRLSSRRPVVFAALAESDGGSAAHAFVRALELGREGGRSALDRLVDHLRARDAVLALDGGEAANDFRVLAEALGAHCPHVSLIATSRAPAGAEGERRFTLGGLACEGVSVEAVRTSPAYRLFAEEALRFEPDFVLDAEDAGAFSRICARVGGSPLALKLTARWRRVLSLPQIEARLAEGLDFLSEGPRDAAGEGAPRAVFEGAWRLLDSVQQRCLARLSVFADGFDAADAEHVTDTSLGVLIELKDRGLIERASGGRFHIHALIHDYARERLQEDEAEAQAARMRHAQRFLSRLAPPLGPAQTRLLDETERDFANIEIACRYGLANGMAGLVEERADALFFLLVLRSRFHEGERLFSLDAKGELKAAFAAMRANCLVHVGRVEEAQALARLALERARKPAAQGHAWQALANAAHLQGRHGEARDFYLKALALRTADALGGLYTTLSLGWLDLAEGRAESARQWVREGYRICRGAGHSVGLMHTYMVAGDVAFAERRLADARANFVAALELEEVARDPANRAASLSRLAHIHNELGAHREAEAAAGEAIALSDQLGERRQGAAARIERARARKAMCDLSGARRDLIDAFRAALSLDATPLIARALAALAALEHEAGNDDYAKRLSAALKGAQAELEADGRGEKNAALQEEVEALVMEAELAEARL